MKKIGRIFRIYILDQNALFCSGNSLNQHNIHVFFDKVFEMITERNKLWISNYHILYALYQITTVK